MAFSGTLFKDRPILDEKPSFLQFKKNALRTDRPTDRLTDGRTDRPSYRDVMPHLKKACLFVLTSKQQTRFFSAKTAIFCLKKSFVYTLTKKKLLQPKTCRFCLFFPFFTFFTSKGALPDRAKKSYKSGQ